MEPLSATDSDSSPRDFAVADISSHRRAVHGSSAAAGGRAEGTSEDKLFSGHDQLLLLAEDKAKRHEQLQLQHPLDTTDGICSAHSFASHKSFAPASPRHAAYAASMTPPPPVRSSSFGLPAPSMREKLSVLAVVVHLLKGNIGPGAMSLPNGFSQTGIYAAPVMFVIVALVSVYNMDLLLHCKRMIAPNTPMSFGDVGREILGPKGKLLIDVFLVGTQLGICCVYFTFIATNIHVVLPDKMQSVVHERHLILAIFPVLLLLSWLRTLKRITPFSGLANVAVISGIAIVFYYSIEYEATPEKPRLEPVHIDWSAIPAFYGTAVYSFEGIGLILPIQNEMSSPTLFPRVLAVCMLAILVLFLVIGELPTVAFGRITNGSMTAVLHDYCTGWGVTAANALLAFACTLSFPIQFYPAIQVLEKSMSRPGSLMRPAALPSHHSHSHHHHHHHHHSRQRHHQVGSSHPPPPNFPLTPEIELRDSHASSLSRPHSHLSTLSITPGHIEHRSSTQGPPKLPPFMERVFSMSQYECNRTLYRSMICTTLMIIAICIPDVGLLISLFGAVGSSMLAIIIPPVLYLKLHRHSLSLASKVLHYAIIVVGVAGMIAGTIQAVVDIVKSFG